MKVNFILMTSLALLVLSCGSDQSGTENSPPIEELKPDITDPQIQTTDDTPSSGFTEAEYGLYGLNTDHMIELYETGDYRFYIKDGSSYLIEQGTFVTTDKSIEINPTYTTCMEPQTKFEIKTYAFTRNAAGSIVLEGLEFPAITDFDIESVQEAVCPATVEENPVLDN